jgi:hypothetical protein
MGTGNEKAGDPPPDIPMEVTDEMEAMIRARNTAISATHVKCATGINPVVLPASLIGKPGWLVYMLQSTHNPHELVLGGHHRFLISADGNQMLEDTALSKGCLVSALDPKATFVLLDRQVGDVPPETDVFTHFSSGLPFYIRTDRGIWRLDEGRMSWNEKKR